MGIGMMFFKKKPKEYKDFVVNGKTVTMERKGKYYWLAICPFHEEKNPSFTLNLHPKDNNFHCFGCGFHQDFEESKA